MVLRWFGGLALWEDDEDEDPEMGGLRMKEDRKLAPDCDLLVVEARRQRDAAAHALAEKEQKVRELRELINPPVREVEVRTPGKAWSVFGLRDVEHVATRHEQSAVDPRAARRAALELPEAELAELEARDRLDAAEAALREARRAAWSRAVPESDARVRAALAGFAHDLERVADLMTATLAIVHEENQRLGLDHNGRPRYDVPNISFNPLLRDPSREAPADFWIRYQRTAGLLE